MSGECRLADVHIVASEENMHFCLLWCTYHIEILGNCVFECGENAPSLPERQFLRKEDDETVLVLTTKAEKRNTAKMPRFPEPK